MKTWWTKEEIKTSNIVVPNRFKNMSTSELTMLMENMLMMLGPTFDDWKAKDGPESEVTDCLRYLTIIWEELKQR